MSSSWGEVKGWWAASQVLVSSSHSYMGKSVTQRNLKSSAVPVWSKSLCLSANFFASSRRRAPTRFQIHCGS